MPAKENRGATILGIYAVIALLWMMTIMTVSDIITDAAMPSVSVGRKKLGADATFETIDKALTAKRATTIHGFSGDGRDPFRAEEQRAVSGRKSAKIRPKCNPSLKGILNKADPLAIILDEAGQSHICKQGDSVCGLKVVSITKENVVLAGPGGKVTLSLPGK